VCVVGIDGGPLVPLCCGQGLAFDCVPDGPDEADEFARDGSGDLSGWLSVKGEFRELPMQTLLSLPGRVRNVRRELGKDGLQALVEPGSVSGVPGRLAENVPEVAVAGARDAALCLPISA
jgi:hypothetical protein